MITTPSRKLYKFALYLVVIFTLSVLGAIFSVVISRSGAEASLLIVSDLTLANQAPADPPYEIVDEGLLPGEAIYVDRAFKYDSSIPEQLLRSTFIRTANDDKGESVEEFLSFKISREATVYVAFDSRAISEPDWLSAEAGWTNTGETIDIGGSDHELLAKDFSGGIVTLGGNSAAGSEFVDPFGISNYTVLIVQKQVPAGLLVISDLSVNSQDSYPVIDSGLVPGAKIYLDRSITYGDAIPNELRGATYFQMANDDKSSTADVFMTFNLNKDSTVYVAYDNRAVSRPNWLATGEGWVETGESLNNEYDLLSKELSAGVVELGGNRATGASFPADFSQYTVVITQLPVVHLSEFSVDAGEVASISVMLDRVPKGLTGFGLVAEISDLEVGEFVGAEFPSFGDPNLSLVEISPAGFPEASMKFATIELSQGGPQSGDVNIHLADLLVRGKLEGSTTIEIIAVIELTTGEVPFELIEAQLVPGKITVLNVPPKVDVGDDISVAEGENILKQIAIEDPGDEFWNVTVDFGDGSEPQMIESENTNVVLSHAYADNGSYTVDVVVRDEEDSDNDSFNVSVSNVAPTVDAGANQSGVEGSPVGFDDATFNDLGTFDTHTAIVAWGDGQSGPATVTESPIGPPGSTSGLDGLVNVGSHTYADDGVYTVTVTVTDDEGGVDSDTLIVNVGNANPVLGELPDLSARVGDVVTLGPAPFSDPGMLDSHQLTISWGDGVVEFISVPQGSETVSGSHTYHTIDTFTVAAELRDMDGGSTTREFEVNIRGLDARVHFQLEGEQRPATAQAWEKPTTVTLSRDGEDDIVVSQNSVYDAANELAFVDVLGLEPGVYGVTAVSESTLEVIKRDVELNASANVNMGSLPAGNANGDSIIDVSDFGLLAASFNTQVGDGGYNPNADFDSNGFINDSDFDLLVSNFAKFSPIEVGE